MKRRIPRKIKKKLKNKLKDNYLCINGFYKAIDFIHDNLDQLCGLPKIDRVLPLTLQQAVAIHNYEQEGSSFTVILDKI